MGHLTAAAWLAPPALPGPGPLPLQVVSCFAGVGGFDLGFAEAGMTTVAACENEPRARAILARKFPDAILYPDIRRLTGAQLTAAGVDGARCVVVGGFPCQDLSMAGSRRGLGGSRSGLFFEIMRVADELRAFWVVLENVPGLLSSTCPCPGAGECVANGRAVRCRGESHTVTGGACPGGCMAAHGGAMGVVVGTLGQFGYGYAWRVLDAQHFGVPQRRDRVFIVGCAGDWAAPAEILFEPEVRGRHPAPRGKARRAAAAGAGVRAPKRRKGDVTARPASTAYDPQVGQPGEAANTLQRATWPLMVHEQPEAVPVAERGRDGGMTAEAGEPGDPAYALRGGEGGGASKGGHVLTVDPRMAQPGGDRSPALRASAGGADKPVVAGPAQLDVAQSLTGRPGSDARGDGDLSLVVTPPLLAGGTGLPEPGHQVPVIPIGADAFRGTGQAAGPVMQWRGGSTQDAVVGEDGVSPTLAFASGTHSGHHQPKVIGVLGDVAPALAADDSSEDGTGRGGGYTPIAVPPEPIEGRVLSPGELAAEYGVRRLTPKECERLQGFPDNWTAGQADSVRYRQMGNAVAVPVAGWVGRRIAAAHQQIIGRS